MGRRVWEGGKVVGEDVYFIGEYGGYLEFSFAGVFQKLNRIVILEFFYSRVWGCYCILIFVNRELLVGGVMIFWYSGIWGAVKQVLGVRKVLGNDIGVCSEFWCGQYGEVWWGFCQGWLQGSLGREDSL